MYKMHSGANLIPTNCNNREVRRDSQEKHGTRCFILGAIYSMHPWHAVQCGQCDFIKSLTRRSDETYVHMPVSYYDTASLPQAMDNNCVLHIRLLLPYVATRLLQHYKSTNDEDPAPQPVVRSPINCGITSIPGLIIPGRITRALVGFGLAVFPRH